MAVACLALDEVLLLINSDIEARLGEERCKLLQLLPVHPKLLPPILLPITFLDEPLHALGRALRLETLSGNSRRHTDSFSLPEYPVALLLLSISTALLALAFVPCPAT